MNESTSHVHSCIHCACHNPVLAALEEELFTDENLAAIAAFNLPKAAPVSSEYWLIAAGQCGTIRPMIGGSTAPVDAMGIDGRKVVVTGKLDEVTLYMQQHYPGYQLKTLSANQTLLPGLVEPHVHIVPSALMKAWADLSGFEGQNLRKEYNLTSVKKVLDAYRLQSLYEVVLGNGLDPALMPTVAGKLQPIDNTVLDEQVTSDYPVMLLSASGHTLYLNTQAYHHVFNWNAAIKVKYLTVERYICKTQGKLQELSQIKPAMYTVVEQLQDMFKNKVAPNLEAQFQEANSKGITFIYDAGMTPRYEKALSAYLQGAEQRIRIGAAKLCQSTLQVEELPTYQPVSAYQDIYYGHAKIVADGSNQGLSGYQSVPYACDPTNVGVFNFPDKDTSTPQTLPVTYKELLAKAIRKGWPLMVHANGDRTVSFTLEAYHDAIGEVNKEGLRHRIEHCSLIEKDAHQTDPPTLSQLQLMAKLGISPSFLIGHVGYWGRAFKDMIFPDKYQMLDLCNSALNEGLRISLHSDYTVSPMGPLRMMEQAITRAMEAGDPATPEVLNAEECISAEQALVAATYDAAWQCYADQWVGSLAAGHFADFVILESDPVTCATPYKNMRDIAVAETWINGIQVYIQNT